MVRTRKIIHADSLPNAVDHVQDAWTVYGDPRKIVKFDEISAHVSTNRVFRLTLSDQSRVISKVSSYGSYFQFAEDHDRLARCSSQLTGTRWSGFLADVLTLQGRPFSWYNGSCWAVFYTDVQDGTNLPRVLDETDVKTLATEIATFHLACAEISTSLPPTSNSVKGDAVHLYDLLREPEADQHLGLPPKAISLLQRFTHDLLLHLQKVHYDEWQRIPILVDWNLGNFSVAPSCDPTKSFRLNTRWDYDWFRVESRLLDFYFLSRVSSHTGDKTQFTYSANTLTEPRFLQFVSAYHQVYPLTKLEIEFLPFAYRFFILNYVIREGSRFFRHDLCTQFRHDATDHYLLQSEHLDLSDLYAIVS